MTQSIPQTLPALLRLALDALNSGNVLQRTRAVVELESALAAQPLAVAAIPPGMALVPIEPTRDMLYEIQESCDILPPRGKRIWAQMLAAAPQPPAGQQDRGEAIPAMADENVLALARVAASENHYAGGHCVRMEFTPSNILSFVAGLRTAGRCEYCDGTGDVHRADGEWLGPCTCPFGRAADAIAESPPRGMTPLTDDEIDAALDKAGVPEYGDVPLDYDHQIARVIEAAHGIKEGS